jgi:hypothetical protein
MLTHREVVPYLLGRKLLSTKTVIESDLEVVDASRRNRNYKVISERAPSYLVKQGISQEGTATVAHEAAIYRLLQPNANSNGFGRYLPRCYGYDSEQRILILELLRDAQNQREYYLQRGHFSTTLARALGNALGTLHRLTKVEGKSEEDDPKYGFSDRPHWVLSVHRPDLDFLRKHSQASIEIIKIIQRFPEFCALLDEIRQGWRTETLIHQDLRWDNCIAFARPGSRRKTRLAIVDWEAADLGDPCWDAGSVFSDYLSFWLFSIPITGEAPPERFIELARYPLEKMRPAIRSFWRSYAQSMELDAASADEWLLRAWLFCNSA